MSGNSCPPRHRYVALRTALETAWPATGVIVLAEPGRALRTADVADVLALPVVAEIPVDPRVARAVDAAGQERRSRTSWTAATTTSSPQAHGDAADRDACRPGRASHGGWSDAGAGEAGGKERRHQGRTGGDGTGGDGTGGDGTGGDGTGGDGTGGASALAAGARRAGGPAGSRTGWGLGAALWGGGQRPG